MCRPEIVTNLDQERIKCFCVKRPCSSTTASETINYLKKGPISPYSALSAAKTMK